MLSADDVLMIAGDVVRRPNGVYWSPLTGREVRLGPSAVRLLAAFAVPTSAAVVAADLGVGPDAVVEGVRSLVGHGLLRDCAPPASPEVARRTGLFGMPVTDLAGALRGETSHGVVIGVPYDAGVTYRAGAKFAPEYLRRVSPGLFRSVVRDGRPTGMYDPVRGRRILDGIRLLDIGDLAGVAPRPGGPMLAALTDTVAAVVEAGRVPIVLGGDHSITMSVLDGITRAAEGIGVLHLDAHHDFGQVRTGSRDELHHGNFLDWALGDPAISFVAQVGVRQLTDEVGQAPGRLRCWPGRTALDLPVRDIIASLPPGLRWHVTIDVDVLDPSVLTSTGTLLPGGFGHLETVALLEGLCSGLDVLGVDVVELIAGPSDAPGIIVADILLRTLDAIFHRQKTHAPGFATALAVSERDGASQVADPDAAVPAPALDPAVPALGPAVPVVDPGAPALEPAVPALRRGSRSKVDTTVPEPSLGRVVPGSALPSVVSAPELEEVVPGLPPGQARTGPGDDTAGSRRVGEVDGS
ncbi:Ureohydrolase [Actinoplanes friuliensis DSM 7358]|uniref:Ureohydrolase n=1 Tax=Actinoplanes friuliensis DSM 7358 TaxID=1246995 RepID=U5W1T9_9ACTN|nr:Ureohydrolase [Actinoplanes friuliensis DSM 7358]